MRLMPVAQKSVDAVMTVIEKAVESRWNHAVAVAAVADGDPRKQVDDAIDRFAREMAALGAAAGATAVAPGVGTIAELSTTVAEIGVFTARATELILTVAAIHGHTISTVEERKAWVIAVLAFGDGAEVGLAEATRAVRKGLTKKGASKATNRRLRRLNRTVGMKLLERYGARQGAAAVGRALPLGIGAVIGGSANYAFAKAIGKHADGFFRTLPRTVVTR